jgi:hypothetical protein
MGMFTPCHCIFEIYSFLLDFTGAHSSEFALNLRGDITLELLNSFGTVNTEDTGD